MDKFSLSKATYTMHEEDWWVELNVSWGWYAVNYVLSAYLEYNLLCRLARGWSFPWNIIEAISEIWNVKYNYMKFENLL